MTADGGMRATMTVWTGSPARAVPLPDRERGGSDNSRNRVFRAVLDGEAEAVRTGECDFGDLTSSNYQFAPSGTADHGLARIAMTPRRPHPMRIVGDLFVQPDDGQLVRVEGQMSKRPSFWTRRIDVVHHYTSLAGARVPTSVEATAHVLLVGRYYFSMQWEYESVNGQRVGNPVPRLAQASPQTPVVPYPADRTTTHHRAPSISILSSRTLAPRSFPLGPSSPLSIGPSLYDSRARRRRAPPGEDPMKPSVQKLLE